MSRGILDGMLQNRKHANTHIPSQTSFSAPTAKAAGAFHFSSYNLQTFIMQSR